VTTALQRTVEAIWRIEGAPLIGRLARLVRDIDLAEDIAQTTFLEALESWPAKGVPEQPRAWLLTTARNRALDSLRRQGMIARHQGADRASLVASLAGTAVEAHASDDGVGDDVLRLMLIACHSALSEEARVALTLRLVGGLTTAEIARAVLQTETTVAQRIVRAKRTLSEARVPFEIPNGDELQIRIASVLQVIYAIFNEGYSATRGEQVIRIDLCEEAMRLGRILCTLVPRDPEAHGLLALMELQASRFRTRLGHSGELVPLPEQQRSQWDYVLIRRGLATLARADSLRSPRGPYVLQAALAACHARARTPDATDWKEIVAIYDALSVLASSPVVELNRAVAIGMVSGPAAALAVVDGLANEPALQNYHHLPSVRGDLLLKLGRPEEARAEFERAAALTQNSREREFLLGRARRCGATHVN
jgi:RNA polymerase sigma factor (sigma-70 family)